MNMLRQTLAGLFLLLAFTVVFGLGYPLLMTGIGQVAFHDQANGSMVQVQGKDVGSSLIGQEFKGAQWFQSRPSAGVVRRAGLGRHQPRPELARPAEGGPEGPRPTSPGRTASPRPTSRRTRSPRAAPGSTLTSARRTPTSRSPGSRGPGG